MGLRQTILVLFALTTCSLAFGQEAGAQPVSFWKIKQGETVDLAPYKFFLPESRSIELKDWKDKAVLIIYVRAFDKPSLDFLKKFEETAWPAIRNKNIVCVIAGHGDQLPSMLSWFEDNHCNFTFPVANDPSHRLHNTLCSVAQRFPHIVVLDKEHRFCVGIVGGGDLASEEFIKMIDQVIDVGCSPAS